MVKKYKKKPVIIEAIQFTGKNYDEVLQFCGKNVFIESNNINNNIIINTKEGDMKAKKNDYIIKGVAHEFYSCKPDIFQETYTEE